MNDFIAENKSEDIVEGYYICETLFEINEIVEKDIIFEILDSEIRLIENEANASSLMKLSLFKSDKSR